MTNLAARAFFLLITLVSIIFSLYLVVPLFDAQPWTLNNDHLIPFDHLRLLASEPGIGPLDIVVARIPSIFPDYLIAAITRISFGDWLRRFSLYWHFSIGLCIFSMLCLASYAGSLSSARPLRFVSSCSVIFIALCYFFPSYRDIVFYSGFPIYHGGNFLNVCISSLFLMSLLSRSVASSISIARPCLTRLEKLALFGFVCVGSFSSRLYIVQFVIPAFTTYVLLNYCMARNAARNGFGTSALRGLVAPVALGAFLGASAYNLSVHQCTDVGITASLSVFFEQIARINAKGLVFLSAIIFAYLSYDSLRTFYASLSDSKFDHWRQKSHSAFIFVFLALSSFGTVFVFFLAAVDEWSGYVRYLITVAYWLPILMALALGAVSRPCLSSSFLFCLRQRFASLATRSPNHSTPLWTEFLLLLCLFSLLPLSAHLLAVSTADRALAMKLSHPAPVSWLRDVLSKNNLDGSLGYVAEPPFESRAIAALTSGNIRSLSISTDGNPLIFPHSRQEYLVDGARSLRALDPNPQDALAPSWVLASSSNTERLFEKYGPPLAVLGCNEDGSCVYRFDPVKVRDSISKFLSSWKVDQYRCLDNKSFLGSLLSNLKKSFRSEYR